MASSITTGDRNQSPDSPHDAVQEPPYSEALVADLHAGIGPQIMDPPRGASSPPQVLAGKIGCPASSVAASVLEASQACRHLEQEDPGCSAKAAAERSTIRRGK